MGGGGGGGRKGWVGWLTCGRVEHSRGGNEAVDPPEGARACMRERRWVHQVQLWSLWCSRTCSINGMTPMTRVSFSCAAKRSNSGRTATVEEQQQWKSSKEQPKHKAHIERRVDDPYHATGVPVQRQAPHPATVGATGQHTPVPHPDETYPYTFVGPDGPVSFVLLRACGQALGVGRPPGFRHQHLYTNQARVQKSQHTACRCSAARVECVCSRAGEQGKGTCALHPVTRTRPSRASHLSAPRPTLQLEQRFPRLPRAM